MLQTRAGKLAPWMVAGVVLVVCAGSGRSASAEPAPLAKPRAPAGSEQTHRSSAPDTPIQRGRGHFLRDWVDARSGFIRRRVGPDVQCHIVRRVPQIGRPRRRREEGKQCRIGQHHFASRRRRRIAPRQFDALSSGVCRRHGVGPPHDRDAQIQHQPKISGLAVESNGDAESETRRRGEVPAGGESRTGPAWRQRGRRTERRTNRVSFKT